MGPLWYCLNIPLHNAPNRSVLLWYTGRLPGPFLSSATVSPQIPHGAGAAGRIRRGQPNYHANPGPGPSPWCGRVCAHWATLISRFLLSKAPDSSQRIILAFRIALKCTSWFEKVLTSTICYFSLNNLHFKVNTAFISECTSVCCLNWSQRSMKKMLVFYWARMFSSTKWHQSQRSSFKR